MGPARMYWQMPKEVPVVKWQGGELLAWRVWDLRRAADGGLRLLSLYQGTVWEGPVFTADHRPLAVPGRGSGVYALKPGTRPNRQSFDWGMGAETWVRGWVALSGQVVEHELGYRAERVVIRRLRLGAAAHRCFRSPEQLARLRDELEQRYQCPVKITGVDARIARGFPSPMYLRPVDPRFGQLVAGTARSPVPSPLPSGAASARAPRATVDSWPRRPKGVSPDGIRYDALQRAFAEARRVLGTDWKLKGRGHCRRVTLKAHYARRARLGAARATARFTPRRAQSPHWIFGLSLVHKAAAFLGVPREVLISKEF